MHAETADALLTCADPEKFLEWGGGVTFRPGGVQLHTSGVVINLLKWVDHGTDSFFLVHAEARTRFDDINKP